MLGQILCFFIEYNRNCQYHSILSKDFANNLIISKFMQHTIISNWCEQILQQIEINIFYENFVIFLCRTNPIRFNTLCRYAHKQSNIKCTEAHFISFVLFGIYILYNIGLPDRYRFSVLLSL